MEEHKTIFKRVKYLGLLSIFKVLSLRRENRGEDGKDYLNLKTTLMNQELIQITQNLVIQKENGNDLKILDRDELKVYKAMESMHIGKCSRIEVIGEQGKGSNKFEFNNIFNIIRITIRLDAKNFIIVFHFYNLLI